MIQDVLVVVGVGGMGEAVARRCGAGRTVLLADFSEEALARVSNALTGDGFRVETRVVDVSSSASLTELAEHAETLGAVRSVVHTAGLSPAQAPTEAILAVDLAGVAFGLDAFGAVIAPGGAGVFIASMAGTMAAGGLPAELESALATTPSGQLVTLPAFQSDAFADPGAAYAVAKRGNQLRVQAASLAWGQRGARVNSISPGVISTPMGQQELGGDSGTRMRKMIENFALGRAGTSADIANATAFLLSSDSAFITGTDLLIDGGVVAGVRAVAR